MKLSESKSGDFTPHPETDGTAVRAVIVDITPLKKRVTQYGEKEEFRIVFETEVADDEGKRFCIWSRGYTPSLNEKAAIRKDLKKMMGRDLTAAELAEFDCDGLLGMGVKLIVMHEESEGKTYANISFIAPDKGAALKPSGKYVRVQDRPARDDAKGGASGSASTYRKAPAATEEEGRAEWQKVKVHVGKHAGVDLGDLDSEAVEALIEKWLPVGKEMKKPLKADRELIAALEEVQALMASLTEPAAEPEAAAAEY